jgi:transmembrane sensor
MSKIVRISERKDSEHADVEAEARAWVIALDGEAPSSEKLCEFRAWLQRSPRHREAFKTAAGVWGDLDQWSRNLYPAGESAERPAVRRKDPYRSRRLRPALVAASLAALAASLVLTRTSDEEPRAPDRFAAGYSSATGEVKSVTLPDGTEVRLNTQSRIEVSYARTARVVHLTEGEAYFQVAHDAEQPFVVYSGRYAVKAVGTAFSVQRLSGGVELNVTEGRVEVATLPHQVRDDAAPDVDVMQQAISMAPFSKGQRAVLKEDQAELELVQTVSDAEMEVELAWRNGLLIFDDDPLEEVVAEISRYTPMRIVIADSAIRDLRIGGYFRVNDVPAILTSMEKGFGLHVERVDDKLIYLSRQAGTQPGP